MTRSRPKTGPVAGVVHQFEIHQAVWADGKKIEVARDGDGYIAAATVALRTS